MEREIPDEPVPEQETQYADDTDEPEVDEDEEDVDTREDWEYIREARDYALALLQNREKPLGARLGRISGLCRPGAGMLKLGGAVEIER